MKKPKKILASFEIQEEIERPVSDDFAKKYSPNIRFDLIVNLRKSGKVVRAALLKNNQIAFIIQSPLYLYFENKKIDDELFAVGLQYSRDYFISAQDNMAKQSYDGTGLNAKNFKRPSKEPSQHQIESHRRIEAVKLELNRMSQYPIAKQKIYNKRYVQLIELFLEKEMNISEIIVTMKTTHERVLTSIFEALEIMKKAYERMQKQAIHG